MIFRNVSIVKIIRKAYSTVSCIDGEKEKDEREGKGEEEVGTGEGRKRNKKNLTLKNFTLWTNGSAGGSK